MEDFYKNKKILITGHTGFKGSWLSQVLTNMGADVVGVSLAPIGENNLFSVLKNAKIKNYFVDIRDIKELKAVFDLEKPEIVFHLAAQAIVRTSYEDPLNTHSSNVMGTANVLDVIRGTGFVKSVVIITTDKVYENKEWIYPYRESDMLGGHDPYSSSKAAADIISSSYIQSYFNIAEYGKKHNTLVSIARAGNVIGGGDWADYRLVPDIIRSVFLENKDIIIRSPESIRPWEHVLEPLSGYMMLAKELFAGNTDYVGPWNFGPDHNGFVCVEDFVKNSLIHLEKGKYIVERDFTKHEANILKLDISKAKTVLKWKPKLSFDENIDFTFSWYKAYYDKDKKVDMVEFTNDQIKHFFNIK